VTVWKIQISDAVVDAEGLKANWSQKFKVDGGAENVG